MHTISAGQHERYADFFVPTLSGPRWLWAMNINKVSGEEQTQKTVK